MVKHTPIQSTSLPSQKRAVIWKAVSSERQADEEKVSLPEQERLARQWCEDNGYHIVRVLEVPGYSRRESDIVTALEDFAEQGIYAYHDLRRMWINREFDVLVALSHDRLGRSNTLHSWVLENVIMNGMQIYFLYDGGWVDLDDFRYKLAIGGMMAATPVDRLVKAAAVAKDKLTMQGLPIGAHVPISHKRIRDAESGKQLSIEVNEELRPLFDDLAKLLLEGVAYNLLSKELYQRYGHKTRTGKLYRSNQFFDLLYTPAFWGHMAKGYSTSSRNGNVRGAWIFDETVPPPPGVLVARNVVPAVYTGELAEAIKAEMYRRMGMRNGRGKPSDTYRFAGLFVCGICGCSMSTHSKPGYGRRGLKCAGAYSRVMDEKCTERRLVPHRYLQDEINRLLEQLIEGVTPQIFEHEQQGDNTLQKLESLKRQVDLLENKLANLIDEQSNAANNTTREMYRKQIEITGEHLERENEELLGLQRKLDENLHISHEETRTVKELRKLTLECFWKLPDREINQWLRRLMGKRKFVIVSQKIVDVAEPPPKKRSSPFSRIR
jgi:DNA invertase Pin-like site-specific DNA recombinase